MNEEFRVLCKKFLIEKENTNNIRAILKLLELNKSYRYDFWNYNCMPLLLLEELSRCYDIIKTPEYTEIENSRLCTILNIIQTILNDSTIKDEFIESEFTCYLYPFMNIDDVHIKYESLRVACLGIICVLLQDDDDKAIDHLKRTEIVPLSLKIMEIGTETSKYLALHVFSKIASNEEGLIYMCGSFNRFISVIIIFNSMLYQMASFPNIKLIKLILKCIITMCKVPNIRKSFKNRQMDGFSNVNIMRHIKDDAEAHGLYDSFIRLTSEDQ